MGGGGQTTSDFAIADVALGMTFEDAVELYPDARLVPAVPNCHRFGKAIRLPDRTPRILRYEGAAGDLTMRFDPLVAGGRLARILFDRPVDPEAFDIQATVARLEARYGRYDRLLKRRKMEPAGRVVGFEWHGPGGALFRVELREDYTDPAYVLRLTYLALAPKAQRRRDTAMAPSPCDTPLAAD